MKLLILGGTGFLGPHIVEAALKRGHEMTLFNRGKTNPHLFPDLEKLDGDRDPNVEEGLTPLQGRKWDAVIDTSGYVPRHVKASAELLAPNVKQYVFVSSISVYPMDAFVNAGVNETTPVGTIEDPTVEQVNGETYGPLKALCEQAAEAAMPGRVTNIRPGLIVGPMDPTDRFSYWPVRLERGGEVAAPGDGSTFVQYIDARDLAAFIIKTIEDGHPGVYNATGPAAPLTMAGLVYGCDAVTSEPSTITWIDEAFLAERQVGAWSDMPGWSPRELPGFGQVKVDKARAIGLTYRPLAETARDTLDWFRKERGIDDRLRAGLSADRETELLAAWHARVHNAHEEAAVGAGESNG